MPLQKQPIAINFSQGLNLKADPYQIPIGQFSALENSIFTTAGRLTKRNGFAEITTLPNENQTTLTTLNGNLIATGSNLYAFSEETDQWLNQGVIQPVTLAVKPIVRTSTNQSVVDSAVTEAGLALIVYFDSSLNQVYYQVSDNNTGQTIVPRVALPASTFDGRAFILGQYFIVTYLQTTSGNVSLNYIAMPLGAPNSPLAPVRMESGLKVTNCGYDGILANGVLYLGYATAANTMSLGALTNNLVIAAPAIIPTATARLVSMAVDNSGALPNIWMSYWDDFTNNGYAVKYTHNLLQVLAPIPIIIDVQIAEITSICNNGILNIIYENVNTYGTGAYATTRTDFLSTMSVSSVGVPTAPAPIVRSVGLASKAFNSSLTGSNYVIATYGGQNQPTYFLMDFTGAIYMRLAYSNGGGYQSSQILPSVSSLSNSFVVSYLYKDFITTVNKGTDLPNGVPVNSIYTQTGINLATFSINNSGQYSSEIAGALHLSGGIVWEYDGVKPTELGFNVWPENISASGNQTGGALAAEQFFYQFTYEWTDSQGNIHRSAPSIPTSLDLSKMQPIGTSFMGTGASGSNILAVSSTAGLNIGQTVLDTTTSATIPTSTTITNVGTAFQAVFTTGAPQLTVSSNAGLYIGQIVSDLSASGALQAGTMITGITGLTVAINHNPLANSASTPGDNMLATGGPTSTITLSNNLTATATANTIITTTLGTSASFVNNSYNITIANASGFQVGQVITDLTNSMAIEAFTTITAINGNVLTLSNPTFAVATADIIVTADLLSVNLIVPTLRLTYKTGINPVRIVGYRWSAAQQTYYQFTSITMPVLNNPNVDYVSISDTLADAAILGNAIIYTNGGVLEDIAPPASIHTALFSNRLWLIDAEDRNLLWFSKQVIENVPVEMADLLTMYVAPTSGAQGSTGPMTALAAMDDKLIIFKKDAIYYVNGIGPDNTGANSQFSDPVFITSAVGCANPGSIVLMPNGLMFQSDKGIWILGRDLNTNYIGAPVEAYNSIIVNSAQTIPGTNQVRFVLDNNLTLVYDFFFNQWCTFNNIYAISSTLYQGYQTYLNEYGAVFQETPGIYLDGSQPVLMSLTTGWINIAGLQGYERFYQMYLLGTYYTPFNLNISLAYDYNQSAVQQTLITPNNYTPAWGGDSVWGSDTAWGGPGNVFEARLFPQKQKCESFQVTVQEIFDSTYSNNSGAGLSLSGLNLIIGMKKGYRTQSAAKSFG